VLFAKDIAEGVAPRFVSFEQGCANTLVQGAGYLLKNEGELHFSIWA